MSFLLAKSPPSLLLLLLLLLYLLWKFEESKLSLLSRSWFVKKDPRSSVLCCDLSWRTSRQAPGGGDLCSTVQSKQNLIKDSAGVAAVVTISVDVAILKTQDFENTGPGSNPYTNKLQKRPNFSPKLRAEINFCHQIFLLCPSKATAGTTDHCSAGVHGTWFAVLRCSRVAYICLF
jgi:hypothetical protein